jgi:hypothetical protein
MIMRLFLSWWSWSIMGFGYDKDSIQLIKTFYNHQKLIFFCMPCACSLGQCKAINGEPLVRKAHEGLFKY